MSVCDLIRALVSVDHYRLGMDGRDVLCLMKTHDGMQLNSVVGMWVATPSNTSSHENRHNSKFPRRQQMPKQCCGGTRLVVCSPFIVVNVWFGEITQQALPLARLPPGFPLASSYPLLGASATRDSLRASKILIQVDTLIPHPKVLIFRKSSSPGVWFSQNSRRRKLGVDGISL